MRKIFTCFTMVFLVIFSQKNYAQSFEFDMNSLDFNIEFEINEYNFPDTNQGTWIFFINNFESYPAEWDDGKIVLSNPSKLWLSSGYTYTCFAGFTNIFGEKRYTKNFTFTAPTVNVTLDYFIENGVLHTVASIDDNHCLFVDRINTRFYFFDHHLGVGEDLKVKQEFFFPDEFWDPKETNFTGEYALNRAYPSWQKGLSFGVDLVDSRGQKRLQAYAYTVMGFVDQLRIAHNLTSIGAITPYWLDSEEREAKVFDTSGKLVAEFLAKSGEPFWPSSYFSTAGIYFLQVEGVGTQKFAKF